MTTKLNENPSGSQHEPNSLKLGTGKRAEKEGGKTSINRRS